MTYEDIKQSQEIRTYITQADASLVATVVQLCAARLPKTYGEMAVTGTQVIAPSRKGEAGTGNLNRVLQAALNPPAPGKKEHLFREQIFRDRETAKKIIYKL